MDNMIKTRFFMELLPELVKGGRTEHVNMHGKLSVAGQFHQRSGQGMKAHIRIPARTGNHQEDIDSIFGQILRQRQRIVQVFVYLPFNPAVVGQGAAFGIMQGLPRPGKYAGIIRRNFQVQIFQALLPGLLKPEISLLLKQGFEAALAPFLQAVLDALSHIRIGPCG
jgi:hypothetical protein